MITRRDLLKSSALLPILPYLPKEKPKSTIQQYIKDYQNIAIICSEHPKSFSIALSILDNLLPFNLEHTYKIGNNFGICDDKIWVDSLNYLPIPSNNFNFEKTYSLRTQKDWFKHYSINEKNADIVIAVAPVCPNGLPVGEFKSYLTMPKEIIIWNPSTPEDDYDICLPLDIVYNTM